MSPRDFNLDIDNALHSLKCEAEDLLGVVLPKVELAPNEKLQGAIQVEGEVTDEVVKVYVAMAEYEGRICFKLDACGELGHFTPSSIAFTPRQARIFALALLQSAARLER